MAHSSHAAIAAIRNAIDEVSSDEDFAESLHLMTQRQFRPSSAQTSNTRRGRKRKSAWKKKIFLLRRANCDFYPSLVECEFLSESGLGLRKAEFNRSWGIQEAESYIESLYPTAPLHLVGFVYAKCDRRRRIVEFDAGGTVEELEKNAGQGVLILKPKRDLPVAELHNREETQAPAPNNRLLTPSLAIRRSRSRMPNSSSSTAPSLRPSTSTTSSVIQNSVVESIDASSSSSSANIHTSAVIEIFDNTEYVQPAMNLQDLLRKYMEPRAEEGVTLFNVTRENVFDSALRAMRRPSFSPLKLPSVMFMDLIDTPEGAIDAGGPRREFFRLAMKEMSVCLCEGPDTAKQLCLRSDYLNENTYFHAATLIGMSLIHGGSGPACFSKRFFKHLIAKEPLMDILNEDILSEIKKIAEAEDLQTLNSILGENNTYLTAAGSPTYVGNFAKKESILKGVTDFYSLHRNLPAIEQFRDGFQKLELFKLMCENEEMFEKEFCEGMALTSSDFLTHFKITLSDAGSNNRMLENRALSFFRDFLIDCEEKLVPCSIEEVFTFSTGASKPPPLGFDLQPAIEFLSEGELFPKANTCALVLKLPVCYTSYEIFKEKFVYGIKEGMVFGFE